MPVPKRKRSKARRDKRFANKGLQVKAVAQCKNCQAALLPHQVCRECGHYKGVKVIKTKVDRSLERTAKKQSQAQARAARTPSSAGQQEQA